MYAFEIAGGYTFYKYRDFDGTVSLSRAHLHWFWRLMSCSGLGSVVFYDGSVVNFNGFLKVAEAPDQHFFLGFKAGEPSGMFWLNGFGVRTCFIHMAIMPSFHRKGTIEMGRGVLCHLLTARDIEGEYFLKNVKGLVPAINPLACRMAELSGFKKTGTLENDAYIARLDNQVDASLYCATLNGLVTRGFINKPDKNFY